MLRSSLTAVRGTYLAASSTSPLLVALPAGQHHELSALMAALAGAAEGWRVTYLGPDLPAQLDRSRRGAGPELPILVFGGAAAAYGATVAAIGAEQVAGVGPLRVALGWLRRPSPDTSIH